MTASLSRSLSLGLLLASACTEGGTADSIPTPVMPPDAAACTPHWQEDVGVVACGFGPTIALIGVEDGIAYAASDAGSFFRVDVESSAKTKLYRSLFSTELGSLVLGSVVQNEQLYFPSLIEEEDYITGGLVRIDGSTPTATPHVVTYGNQYEPSGAMIASSARLYVSSIGHEDFSAFSGPVIAMELDGSAQVAVTPDYGSPLGVVDGYLYYMHGNDAQRVRTTGGAATLIASDLAFGSYTNRAIDADFVYATTAAEPYRIQRFPVGGGTPSLLVEADAGNIEMMVDPPRDLRIDGEWLYFLQGTTYASLTRVRLDGTGELEHLVSGQGLSAPVFDATTIYFSLTEGGFDAPIEGIVARKLKTSCPGGC